ncbi:DNA-directed RNA polymerase subunit beta [Nocardia spumae]|uniref:DNA-directed RNA polymerase subunit beta n=1 Tax=Nocardia spumae TaxID=2887190 RepID=UPI001D144451|nr:DNA-directed RNA polymerase subunit beta [Nocardia spumae]
MNQSPVSEPTDSAYGRRDFYRKRYGLPASVEPYANRIVVKVGVIAAITMPEPLGGRVLDALTARGTATGPIILHTHSRRWTFLLEPDIPFEDYELYAEMYRRSVTIAPIGASVALPAPTDPEDGYRVWKQLPPSDSRPSAALVIELIRDFARQHYLSAGADLAAPDEVN